MKQPLIQAAEARGLNHHGFPRHRLTGEIDGIHIRIEECLDSPFRITFIHWLVSKDARKRPFVAAEWWPVGYVTIVAAQLKGSYMTDFDDQAIHGALKASLEGEATAERFRHMGWELGPNGLELFGCVLGRIDGTEVDAVLDMLIGAIQSFQGHMEQHGPELRGGVHI